MMQRPKPKDNLFSLSAVERVLNEGKEVVLSCRADKPPLYRSKFSFLLNFTIWNDIFPLDSTSVLHSLEEVVRRLYQLGLYLGVPASSVDAIEADFHTTDRRRVQLVRVSVLHNCGQVSHKPIYSDSDFPSVSNIMIQIAQALICSVNVILQLPNK